MSQPPAPEFTAFDEDWESALCIAAHPDDLEYGLAAAVARWTGQGKRITYLLATSGEAGIDTMHPDECRAVREQEERDGALRVGVDVVEFLGLPDGALEYGFALRKGLAAEIRRRRPDRVFTLTHRERFAGGGTNQADHRAVGLAAIDACADAGNRWIFTDLLEEQGLEPWSGVRAVGLAASPESTHVVTLEPDHVEAGIASLEAHAQYLDALEDDYPSPRTLLEGILGDGDGGHRLTLEVFDQ